MIGFGSRLRILRAAHAVSQEHLGEWASVDAKFISHIETGKMLPSPAWDTRLREALGWTPAVDEALDQLAVALDGAGGLPFRPREGR